MAWIWIVTLFLGILLLISALILTFVWRISSLMDDLSGRKAKKQLEKAESYTTAVDVTGTNSIDTDSFFKAIEEGKTSSGEVSSSVNISAMLDDPYKAVLQETGVAPNMKTNLKRMKQDYYSKSQKEHKIVLVKEQTSLKEGM